MSAVADVARVVQTFLNWTGSDVGGTLALSHAQFDALVLGLPWQRIGEAGVITLL